MFCMTHKPGPKPKPLDQLSEKTLRNRGLLRTRNFATETHCANGHEWTEETIYEYPDKRYPGGMRRVCKICQRDAQRVYQGKPPLGGKIPIGIRNRDKTHCPQNHEYTEENTGYRGSNRSRYCKRCVRNRRIWSQYGLEPEEFDAIMEAQENGCAVCEIKFTDEERPHVDHNHKTGRVRGFLCNNCNNGIGRFEDDPWILRRAADYLERELMEVQ